MCIYTCLRTTIHIVRLAATHLVQRSCYLEHLLKAAAIDDAPHDPRHSVVPPTTAAHVPTAQDNLFYSLWCLQPPDTTSRTKNLRECSVRHYIAFVVWVTPIHRVEKCMVCVSRASYM